MYKRQVLGCGPDICYPRHNAGLYRMLENKGGLLSEYPPGTPPVAWHFPYRNRIISGLSDAVLVVEARLKSGSLITADYALEQGKDVYAVPGRIEDPLSQGCNRLISQGAGVFCSLEGFLSELGLTNRNYENFRKNDLTLEKTESMVYSCVDFRGKSLEAIRMETGLSREAVLTACLLYTSCRQHCGRADPGKKSKRTESFFRRTGTGTAKRKGAADPGNRY